MTTDSSKLQRLKRLLYPPPDWSDWEFTMIVLGRPISFILVWLFEGLSFVTPNLLTVAAFTCLLAGTAMLAATPDYPWTVALLLFARMVLDDTDGMLARFRGQTSKFGSYLDKVMDAVGFFLLFAVVGVRASGQVEPAWAPWMVVISVSGAFSLLLMGYVKHVARVEEFTATGVNPRPGSNASNAPTMPPLGQFLVKLFARIAVPMESDLLLFSCIGIVLRRYDLLAWFYGIGQGIGAIAMVFKRAYQVAALDRNPKYPTS